MSKKRPKSPQPFSPSSSGSLERAVQNGALEPLQWREVFIDAPVKLLALDGQGAMLACTGELASALGYKSAELTGVSIADFIPDYERSHVMEQLRTCLDRRRNTHRWRTCHYLAEGGLAWFDVTATVSDNGTTPPTVILHYRGELAPGANGDALSSRADYDILTNLVNQSGFQRALQKLLFDLRRDQAEHALGLLDLDQFKVVNEVYGHAAGDALLNRIAQLLRGVARKSDRVGRLGGDEFAVLMVDCSIEEAARTTELLREAIAHLRFKWRRHTIRISASVGLVAINEKVTDAASVLRSAESACGIAKDLGRNRTYVHDPHDSRLTQRNMELEWVARIRHALEERRFRLAVQPIVSLHRPRRRERFVEVLLRLADDEGALVSPSVFMLAAERYNLVTAIDRWVITRAFEWLADSPYSAGGPSLCFINVSGHSLGSQDFYQLVARASQRSNVAGSRVCFEITESTSIADIQTAGSLINELKAQGFRFALDDVGSGVSSFAYLRNLPVDFVKIDGSLVRDVAVDTVALATVRCIHELARVMGKTTIAEFAESPEIVSQIAELGVDYAQGYALGRPAPLSN